MAHNPLSVCQAYNPEFSNFQNSAYTEIISNNTPVVRHDNEPVHLRSKSIVRSKQHVMPKICIICGKVNIYKKNSRSKESLSQAETVTAGELNLTLKNLHAFTMMY